MAEPSKVTADVKVDWVSPRDLMPRVDAIYRHPRFQHELARIEEFERDRVWCHHGLSHLLDVARIAWIECLDAAPRDPVASRDPAALPSRELVYAAALLHDIGRAEQYGMGTPHDEAGERIASEILGTVDEAVRFSPEDADAILAAVRGHRGRVERMPEGGDDASAVLGAGAVLQRARVLQHAIATADKASRACFACSARSTCKWPDAKKNLTVVA